MWFENWICVLIYVYLITNVDSISLNTDKLPAIKSLSFNFIEAIRDNSKILELQCNTELNGDTKVDFYFQDELINRNDSRIQSISAINLSIDKVLYPQDDGKYKCIACNKYGCTAKQVEVQIPVIGNFAVGSRDNDPVRTIDVVLNHAVEIICPYHTLTQPLTQVRWGSKANFKFLKETKYLTFIKNNKVIYISNVTQAIVDIVNEFGGIQCMLFSNQRQIYSNKMKLKITPGLSTDFKPTIYLKPAKLSYVMEGDEKNLQCLHSGNPRPTTSWFMNGEEIFSNNTLFHFDAENPSQLIIKEFNKRYEGEYKCMIKNKLGDDTATGNLSLAVMPTIKALRSSGILTNKTLNITCCTEGTLPMTYQWLYNGINVITRNNRSMVSGNRLLISPTELYDTGTYTCVAINQFDETQKQINIVVVETMEELVKLEGERKIILKDASYMVKYELATIILSLLLYVLST